MPSVLAIEIACFSGLVLRDHDNYSIQLTVVG